MGYSNKDNYDIYSPGHLLIINSCDISILCHVKVYNKPQRTDMSVMTVFSDTWSQRCGMSKLSILSYSL